MQMFNVCKYIYKYFITEILTDDDIVRGHNSYCSF